VSNASCNIRRECCVPETVSLSNKPWPAWLSCFLLSLSSLSLCITELAKRSIQGWHRSLGDGSFSKRDYLSHVLSFMPSTCRTLVTFWVLATFTTIRGYNCWIPLSSRWKYYISELCINWNIKINFSYNKIMICIIIWHEILPFWFNDLI
jgi:hypothetical protein